MNIADKIQHIQSVISDLEISTVYSVTKKSHRLQEARVKLANYTAKINDIEVNSPKTIC
jgi:hypothetical protein